MSNKYQTAPTVTLDLHGKTTTEAKFLLKDFFKDVTDRKFSSILIVTGKGIHSASGQSTMRPFVKDWLFNHGYNFRPAKPEQGGDGALVVTT